MERKRRERRNQRRRRKGGNEQKLAPVVMTAKGAILRVCRQCYEQDLGPWMNSRPSQPIGGTANGLV